MAKPNATRGETFADKLRQRGYCTQNELAQLLGVSRMTIHRRMSEGMPFRRVGRCVRFDIDAALAWLDQKR